MLCQFCSRDISNKGSLKAHEIVCAKNPSAIKRARSPKAGAQKGCTSRNKGKVVGRSPRWNEKYPDSQIFAVGSTYSRHSLKSRILDNKLIPHCCAICGIGPEWRGKSMPLILDHINGVNNDNRLVNLRFVCSNCDSQLPTYKSKNRKMVLAGVGSPNGLENRGISLKDNSSMLSGTAILCLRTGTGF